jgi:hypothetical protein
MKFAKRPRPGRRLCTLAALSTGLLLACLVVSGPALARGGNSTNAKLCQKGGWETLQSGTGGTFTSEDACVSYGAQGGSLFNPSVTLDPTHVGEEVTSFVTVVGFHPSSSGDLTIHVLPAGGTVSFLAIPTNTTGGLPVFTTGFTAGACTNGVTGAEITFTDVFGVHASTILTLDCP